MTERIYYADAYCREFEARVCSCEQGKHGYDVVLDRTAFYPEGGGQPGDFGTLEVPGQEGLIKVTDTHERGEDVVHYTEKPIEVGATVRGTINWENRFDLMQNHSGEHIVSGLIHEAYGYENVGFHMGSDFITIDLSGELTMEQLREIERKANEVVWANVLTDIRVYTEEEVKAVTYRSKKELHGEVRIVTFPGGDTCACCGTHVRATGEIGLIKLFSVEKFRGGVRVEMLCGRRALEYVNVVCEQNREVSVALSAKPLETAKAVVRVRDNEGRASFLLSQLQNQILEQKAATLAGAGNVALFQEGLEPEGVRKLAVAVMEQCNGFAAVFSGTDGDGYKYALGETGGDLKALVKSLNTELNGRGGGKPFFAQGSCAATAEQIRAFLTANVEGIRFE